VDAPEQVARVVGRRAVLAGATYIGTALLAPGLIEHTGSNRRVVFGEFFDAAADVSPRVTRIGDALRAADVQVETHADMRVPLWEKFLFLAPMASLAAAARVGTGGIWGDAVLKAQMIAGVREVEAVARRSNVPLPADVVDRIVSYCDALPAAMRPSMLIDITAGKPLEVEALPGSVARRGAAVGVATPVMSTLYAVLRPHATGRQPAR
jgi:2-dehydropantoate 2-reductase